ncbi:MAG: glycoside hydrolase family 9 protein [Lachnospiraceae bacterium]|nr:glycoside hydrolase family 9 protein [Lachnospiraceae bacterium]
MSEEIKNKSEDVKDIAESMQAQEPQKKKKKKWWLIICILLLVLVIGVGAMAAAAFAIIRLVIGAKETGTDANSETSSVEELVSEDGNVDTGDSDVNQDGNDDSTSSFTGNDTNTTINTGELTENATEYEGRQGTGKYNYGEALQKAILFYELQRSGDLPEETRCNWRGDSGLTDGADVGLDLTGGLYDAGDHVKFNLPMAYTASTLAWSVYESRDSYEESGQLVYIQDSIRWINDYLIKCHPEENVFYYQVGDGSADHSWWGPAEVMQMNRPSYKVDMNNPGSTVSAGAAASLASCSVIFAEDDPEYAQECLEHAIQLYEFAASTKSDAGYTAANGFYTSHSGFYDELTWAAAWLYIATGDDSYLADAKTYFAQADTNPKWAHCWDNVSIGAATLLAIETGDSVYTQLVEDNLDFWTTGLNGERITYTPQGLAWLDSWGSLRYATTEAFVALVYSKSDVCPDNKKDTYYDFGVAQVNYALGDTGRSYLIGFGEDYPQNPHHRTAQGSYSNNMNEPKEARHTLYGALVGGPDSNDGYQDEVSNYINNEVACDYNAGIVGALACLYEDFGGQTLVDFGAVEAVPEDEVYIDACVNVSGDNHLEVKAFVTNTSAWPARTMDTVTLRYFMDLSEVYANGGTASDISLNTNYSQGGSAVGVMPWDEENHIYYVEIQFAGEPIYPGGQSSYKKEVQFRMTSASSWDNSNDFSYQDIAGTNGGSLVKASHMALYDNGELIYGTEPDGEGVAVTTPVQGNDSDVQQENGQQSNEQQTDNQGSQSNTQNNQQNNAGSNTASGNQLTMTVDNQSKSGSGSSMSFFITIRNDGTEAVALEDLEIKYFFTDDGEKGINFYCDYACLSGSTYSAITDKVQGEFAAVTGNKTNADTELSITCDSKDALRSGDEVTIQVRVAKEDWSNFDFDNDFSAGGADKVAVFCEGELVIGSQP